MDYIKVTKENIENEHICCAISKNTDCQVSSKKEWLNDLFDQGLVFLKSVERGKCFIEYLPAENAWVPIEAKNYLYIDCLWVAGSFKGNGYSNDLLNACIDDAKRNGRIGICILSSDKKKPFLADPKYLAYKGFKIADVSNTGINLMYISFTNSESKPKFLDNAKFAKNNEEGFVLYYTNQCPFNAKYVPLLEKYACNNNVKFKSIHIKSLEQARMCPSPCTTYSLFYNGKFITNEQQNETRFSKLISEILKNN